MGTRFVCIHTLSAPEVYFFILPVPNLGGSRRGRGEDTMAAAHKNWDTPPPPPAAARLSSVIPASIAPWDITGPGRTLGSQSRLSLISPGASKHQILSHTNLIPIVHTS